MHCDDLADALVFLLKNYSGYGHVNVGSGEEVSIKELAEMIRDIFGFEGELVWDDSKPDGTPPKLMDSNHLTMLGWDYSRCLKKGIEPTYLEWKKQTKPLSFCKP